MKRTQILVSITVATMFAAAADAGAVEPRLSGESPDAAASRPFDDLEAADAAEVTSVERGSDRPTSPSSRRRPPPT